MAHTRVQHAHSQYVSYHPPIFAKKINLAFSVFGVSHGDKCRVINMHLVTLRQSKRKNSEPAQLAPYVKSLPSIGKADLVMHPLAFAVSGCSP